MPSFSFLMLSRIRIVPLTVAIISLFHFLSPLAVSRLLCPIYTNWNYILKKTDEREWARVVCAFMASRHVRTGKIFVSKFVTSAVSRDVHIKRHRERREGEEKVFGLSVAISHSFCVALWKVRPAGRKPTVVRAGFVLDDGPAQRRQRLHSNSTSSTGDHTVLKRKAFVLKLGNDIYRRRTIKEKEEAEKKRVDGTYAHPHTQRHNFSSFVSLLF